MLMIVDQVLADLASRMSTAGPVQQMMAKMGAATKVIIIVMVMMLMISMIFMMLMISTYLIFVTGTTGDARVK